MGHILPTGGATPPIDTTLIIILDKVPESEGAFQFTCDLLLRAGADLMLTIYKINVLLSGGVIPCLQVKMSGTKKSLNHMRAGLKMAFSSDEAHFITYEGDEEITKNSDILYGIEYAQKQ